MSTFLFIMFELLVVGALFWFYSVDDILNR